MRRIVKQASAFVATFGCLLALSAVVSCSADLLKAVEKDVDEVERQKALDDEDNVSAEKRRPTITVFSCTDTDGKTNNPTITINISAEAKAVDSKGAASVAGFLLKETEAAPALDDALWAATAPNSYALNATNGAHTLYLWVKDSFGNISDEAHIPVTLEPLAVTWSAPYSSGATVTAHESFVLTAGEPINSDFTVTGIGAGSATVSASTVTASPTSRWTAGAGTVTVAGHTSYGLTISQSLPVTVFNGACVSTTGNDANAGTIREPVASVSKAIFVCEAKYSGTTSLVKIAKGNYSVDGNGSTKIVVSEGISLQGEYTNNFQTHAPATPLTTVITDTATTGGTPASPVACVNIADNVTNTTSISYLKIIGSNSDSSTSILCKKCNPCIYKNQILIGENTSSAVRYGVFVTGEKGPDISENYINSEKDSNVRLGGGSDVTTCCGIFFYSYTGSFCTIKDNVITGGLTDLLDIGSSSTCIYIDNGSNGIIKIFRNQLFPSNSYITHGIYQGNNSSSILVYNNLICSGVNTNIDFTTSIGLSTRYASPKVKFYNNTIILGYPESATTEYGMHIKNMTSGSEMEICNNLLVYQGGKDTIYAVFQDSSAKPLCLKNNGYQNPAGPGFGPALYRASGTSYTTIANLESFLGSGIASGNVVDGFSFSNTPVLFSLSTADTRGLNGNILGWGFFDDFMKEERIGNWSIGYFEKN